MTAAKTARALALAGGVLALAALAALAPAGCGGSNQIAPTTSAPRIQTSQHGHFVVSYTPRTKLVLNQPQTWLVHVKAAGGGTPVDGATLTVGGGMPDMGHALPTDPLVTGLSGGTYRVEGLQFTMPGAWVVTVHITAGGVSDQASFKLYIQ